MVITSLLYSLFSSFDMKGILSVLCFFFVFIFSLVNCVVLKNEQLSTKPPPQVENLPWLSFLDQHQNAKRKALERYERQNLGETAPLCASGETGQFPYPPDCKRFINCWRGRGAIQVCAPGTLFNPETSECDFPGKVKCIDGEGGFGDYTPLPASERYVRFPHERPQIANNPRIARNQAQPSKTDNVLVQPYPVRPPYFGVSHLKPPTRPTKGSLEGREVRPQCPKGVTGLFPHPTDCTKFLKCWNGNTLIQNCGPGTFYNPLMSVCDHPRNVPCAHEESYIPGDPGLIQEEIQVPEESVQYEQFQDINQNVKPSATKGGKKSARPTYGQQTSQSSTPSSVLESEIEDLQAPVNVKENTTHRKPKIINIGENQPQGQVASSYEKELATHLTPPAHNSAKFDGYRNPISGDNHKTNLGVQPGQNNELDPNPLKKQSQQQVSAQPGQHPYPQNHFLSGVGINQGQLQIPMDKFPIYNYPFQGYNTIYQQEGQDKTKNYYGMMFSKPNGQQFVQPYHSYHLYYPLYHYHHHIPHSQVYPSMHLQPPPMQQNFPHYAPSHPFSHKTGYVPYKIPQGGFNAPLPTRTPYHHAAAPTGNNLCTLGSKQGSGNEPSAPQCEPGIPFYQPGKSDTLSGASNVQQNLGPLCKKPGSTHEPSAPECEPNISYYVPVTIDVESQSSDVKPQVISSTKPSEYYPGIGVQVHQPQPSSFTPGSYRPQGSVKGQQPGNVNPEQQIGGSVKGQQPSSYPGQYGGSSFSQQPGIAYLPQYPGSSNPQPLPGSLSSKQPGTVNLPQYPGSSYPQPQSGSSSLQKPGTVYLPQYPESSFSNSQPGSSLQKPQPGSSYPQSLPGSSQLQPGSSYPQPQPGSSYPQSQPGSSQLQPGSSYPQPQPGSSYPQLQPGSSQFQPGSSYPQPQPGSSYPQPQPGSSYPQPQPGSSYPQLQPGSSQPQPGNSYPHSQPGSSYPQPQPGTLYLPQYPGTVYPQPQPGSSNKPQNNNQQVDSQPQPSNQTPQNKPSFNYNPQVNYYPQYPTGYFPQYQPVHPNANPQNQPNYSPSTSKIDSTSSTQPPSEQGQVSIDDPFSPVYKETDGQEHIKTKPTPGQNPNRDPFSPVYENSDSYIPPKRRPPQETEGQVLIPDPFSSPKDNKNYIDLLPNQNYPGYPGSPDYSYPTNTNEIVQGVPSRDTSRYPVQSSNIISTEPTNEESATFPPYPGKTQQSETSAIKSGVKTRPSGVKSKTDPPKQYLLDKIDLRTKPEDDDRSQPSKDAEKLDDDFIRESKKPSSTHPDKYSQREDELDPKPNTIPDDQHESETKSPEVTEKPRKTTPKPFVKVKQTPPNGQAVRLRNGASHLDGYLEMKDSNSKWGLVCDESGGWDIGEATVACRELGFIRGAELSWQGYPIKSDVEQLYVAVNGINCTGKESLLSECKVTHSAKKQCDIGRNAVGLRCFDNMASHCQPGEILYNQHCYKLHGKENPDDPGIKTDEASEQCKKFGGKLVDITSQYENDFISEWLIKKHPEVTSVATGGIGISVLGRPMWLWEGTSDPMVYERWWSGWSGDQNIPKGSIDGPLCIVLKKTFACADSDDESQRNVEGKDDDTCSADYFFWDVEDCNKLRTSVFICERPMDDIGCIVGNGEGYVGTANTTASGLPCLPWDHPKVVEGLARRGTVQERSGRLSGHNYCRNLGNPDRHPWCFVEGKGNSEYCAIPQCWDSVSGYSRSSGSAPSCDENHFECKPGECIKKEWVCNGVKDCQNGRDEETCTAFTQEFKKHQNKKMSGRGTEKWPNTIEHICAKLCLQRKNFKCKSFSYNRKNKECILSDSNVGLSGGVVSAEGWAYHERISESLSCTIEKGFFGCQNGRCVNISNVCDGKNNCGDASDEKDCKRLGYEIRLNGSPHKHEGRVEVKILGKWGVICDDMFDIRDANVICRELGFKLGAAEVFRHSRYPVSNPLFLVNNLECWGNETSIRECSFPGWGKHNCGPDEIAGVACRIPGLECPVGQWQCKKSLECIPTSYLCDGLEECYDKSDEDNKICSSPIQLRLTGGPNATAGRLEIKYLDTWGTVCDDDFGDEAANAVCRMLGYNGPSVVKKSAYFGPGKGPIWLDRGQCFDHETDFEECKKYLGKENNCDHDEDVSLICSQQDFNQKSPSIKPLAASSIQENTLTTEEKVRQVLITECSDKPKSKYGVRRKFERVVGGTDVVGGAIPWQASVRVKSGARKSVHWCGAIIISPYHVLTASHCLRDYQKAAYSIRVGDYDTEIPDPHEKDFEIEHLYMHPEFSKNINLNNDIGLVKIKGEILFGDSVKPACLAPSRDIYRPGTNCSVSGWGSVSSKSVGFARTLRRAYIPILEPSVCRAPFVYGESLSEGMFCAGRLDGEVDSCQGDSGGPLMCQYEDREYLFGITSWGHGCGRANKPGVYTNVAHYTEWIQEKIQASLK